MNTMEEKTMAILAFLLIIAVDADARTEFAGLLGDAWLFYTNEVWCMCSGCIHLALCAWEITTTLFELMLRLHCTCTVPVVHEICNATFLVAAAMLLVWVRAARVLFVPIRFVETVIGDTQRRATHRRRFPRRLR